MFYEVLIVVYLIVALMLVGFVLIQQGKGADMGASFGSGGSNTVFGSTGSGNFLTRTTAILATLFFVISLILGNQTADKEKAVDDWQNIEVPVLEQAEDSDIPVAPESFTQATNESDVPVVEDEDPNPNVKVHYQINFGSLVEVTMLDEGTGNDLIAGDNVYSVFISAPLSSAGLVEFYISATDFDANTSFEPINAMYSIIIPENSDIELYINELMSSNSNTISDEAGEFDDWF